MNQRDPEHKNSGNGDVLYGHVDAREMFMPVNDRFNSRRSELRQQAGALGVLNIYKLSETSSRHD
jgi:hypothetical protein